VDLLFCNDGMSDVCKCTWRQTYVKAADARHVPWRVAPVAGRDCALNLPDVGVIIMVH
jgi:hypothetical protein